MNRKLKIAILGTRGIPNNFGGFEQCAEKVGTYAARMGHEVTVYNPKEHSLDANEWNGIAIRKIYSNERRLKFAGVFLFDYLSLKDAVTRDLDVILELGYSPSALFYYLRKRSNAKIVTNMAGLEWKRRKWNAVAKAIIKYSEKLALDQSDAVVSDNRGIQDYFRDAYGKETVYIPYGAELVHDPGAELLRRFKAVPYSYYMLVARFQPDNNIEMILDGYALSRPEEPFLVIGDHRNRYGAFLKMKYGKISGIRFLGGVYDYAVLSALRWHAKMYFHGHSCGGTNPSLLEAMASNAYIAAHDNPFNRNVLEEQGYYFRDEQDVKHLIMNHPAGHRDTFTARNREKIAGTYAWKNVTDAYLDLFRKLCDS